MKVFAHPGEFSTPAAGVCLAIGVFDGVHLGHQRVFREMIDDARRHAAAAVAVTFDRHPNAVVAPGRTPPLLQSLAQKIEDIAALGVDALWLIRFDREFSQQSGETFARSMVRDFGRVRSVFVGEAFHFGHRRSGNVALLRRLGPPLGFAAHAVPPVAVDGAVVSSTRVREAVQAADFATARRLLGRDWSLRGEVVHGDELGRQLGFPTANLEVGATVLPPTGVYAAEASLAGQRHGAVVNIGTRPTVADPVPALRIEAHLLDGRFELYGKELALRFRRKLREERRFDSLAELGDQIAQDVLQARGILGAES